MNMPMPRSPPCMRPNSTVPNTASRRPVARESTIAHARCIRLAGLTPSRRVQTRIDFDNSGDNLC
ncbi:hypothetical protein X976_6117 [Burkholderia pseudomallei MSHR7500]|nr:hypothetical protein X976_6117 [Burkholderia pseudomallei MSHR7500]